MTILLSLCRLLDTLNRETQDLVTTLNELRHQLDMGRTQSNARQQQEMLAHQKELINIKNSQHKDLQDLRSTQILELEKLDQSLREGVAPSLDTFRQELEDTTSLLEMERTQRRSDQQRRAEELQKVRDDLRRRGGDSRKKQQSFENTKPSRGEKGVISQNAPPKEAKTSRHSRISLNAKNTLAELACESCDVSDALEDIVGDSRDDAESEDEEYQCPPGTRGDAIHKMLRKAEVIARGVYFLPLDIVEFRARLLAHVRRPSCAAPRRRGPFKSQTKVIITRVPRGRYR